MSEYHSLLKGAIELHCHTSPSLFPRKQTDWELIEDIKVAGMAGVVLKAHEGQTVDRATLIRSKEPNLHVYGGLVCNYFTGGFSPTAVDAAIRLGAKVIWMPTISAEQHLRHFAKTKTRILSTESPFTHPELGLEIWDENKNILSQVHEILQLIADANVILATGHLAAEEVKVLVEAAQEHKVEKVLIQHTDLGIARIPFELEKEFVKKGAILEKCYLACSNDFNNITVKEMAESIKLLGAESCVLVTDYGQKHNIPVVEAISSFVGEMVESGISNPQIEKMIIDNPKQLLGIE